MEACVVFAGAGNGQKLLVRRAKEYAEWTRDSTRCWHRSKYKNGYCKRSSVTGAPKTLQIYLAGGDEGDGNSILTPVAFSGTFGTRKNIRP
jgi:hypothetical protein